MILEALAAGGGTFASLAAISWAVYRPERRERRECERLRHVAELEREAFGEVRSADVLEHLKSCDRERTATVRFDTHRDGQLVARAGQRVDRATLTVSGEDVRALRALVAECEQIKGLIQEKERLDRMRADLGVEGYDPDPHLPELRDALRTRMDRIDAITRAWDTDPQTGPGATRAC